MHEITETWPDGTKKVRPATPEEIAQWENDQAAEIEYQWQQFRHKRNLMLSQCDWTVLADSPTSTAAWKTYRQQLRDLPANTTDPLNPVWPTPPA